MGEAEYRITGDGAPYLVRVRRSADEFHRSIFNGTAEDWAREVVGALNRIIRCSDPATPVPCDVVAAFNDWLDREHAALITAIRADRERSGHPGDDHPALGPPIDVQRAAYVTGTGWVSMERDLEPAGPPVLP